MWLWLQLLFGRRRGGWFVIGRDGERRPAKLPERRCA
jgi:hypothetical protein